LTSAYKISLVTPGSNSSAFMVRVMSFFYKIYVKVRKTGSDECDNEFLDSIKAGEFIDQLRDYQLLKKDFALWN
jgi:hypothetical protein